ncbi:MAG: methyltransferase domain-containing protein [Eubacteriaceae bacterium]|nr:methyltransferase domain-containing protein [Eubacteriaceae bacterium]
MNNSENKFKTYLKLLDASAPVFQCPKCGKKMTTKGKSVTCRKSHSFESSTKGYINMLLGSSKSFYSKELFISRKNIVQAGFFDPLIQELSGIIHSKKTDSQPMTILDAGCGEGSLTKRVRDSLNDPAVSICGIDISKDAIQIAASGSPEVLFAVADLARLPFKDKSFDVVLEVLSPSNYAEFKRVLKKGGSLIKVIPGEGYLKEFREVLFKDSPNKEYSNQNVVDYFKKNVKKSTIREIRYTMTPDKIQLENLIKMTPLALDTEESNLTNPELMEIREVTFHFLVLVSG